MMSSHSKNEINSYQFHSTIKQFNKYEEENKDQAICHYSVIQQLRNKNPLSILYPQQSIPNHSTIDSVKMAKQYSEKQSYPKSVNVSEQISNLKPFVNLPTKLLQKNKKYFRDDAKMKARQNVLRYDIEQLIQKMVDQKERNNVIVLELRQKFSQNINKRRNTTNIKCVNENDNNKRSLYGRKYTCTEFGHLSVSKIPYKIKNCPLQSINKLTASINLQQRPQKKIEPFTVNSQTDSFQSSILSHEIKVFRKLVKDYVKSYKNSTNDEMQVKGNFLQLLKNKIDKSNAKKDEGRISYFREFMWLKEKSADYLEYYLRGTSYITQYQEQSMETNILSRSSESRQKQSVIKNVSEFCSKQQINVMLQTLNSTVLLSILQGQFSYLNAQKNPQSIINRIFLALNINPMNPFQFVTQSQYTKLRKISTKQASHKESSEFLLRFFMQDKEAIKMNDIESIVVNLFKKLKRVLNENALDVLKQQWRLLFEKLIDCLGKGMTDQNKQNTNTANIKKKGSTTNQITRNIFKEVIFNDPFFFWDLVLQLIFLV